ncbi:MAG: flotillin-like protein FloA [Chitinophagaceae bacterium]|nr:flotillin-like protein FloA [Chitinophagaceae bacterium]
MEALILLFACIIGFFTLIYFVPLNLWITAIFSNVRVSLLDLILMRIRKVPPSIIVNSLITATKAGILVLDSEGSTKRRPLKTTDLETHYLAGGNVPQIIRALISADKANINLTFKQATAIDLAGRDVFEAVQISVNPKVIDTPSVAAVAKDGIQLIAKARVTVRANISQLVGGAGEETVLARVGEGIVTSIGSAKSHKEVLENPDKISKLVLSRGLDAGTAFEILSIDIADVDVGANIGAKLQIDQATADLKIAEARAEERRAMAVALEQEMIAKAQEARAKVIEAESEVPLAIAESFRSGNLGIMDYYRMENMKSDTAMRDSISGKTNKVDKKKE